MEEPKNSYDTIAIFDESALGQLHELQVQGQPGFVAGLLAAYLGQLKVLSEEMQSLEKIGDAKGLEQTAHQLKSSSVVLGLARVAAICVAVEQLARKGSATTADVHSLQTATALTIAKLENYLS